MSFTQDERRESAESVLQVCRLVDSATSHIDHKPTGGWSCLALVQVCTKQAPACELRVLAPIGIIGNGGHELLINFEVPEVVQDISR